MTIRAVVVDPNAPAHLTIGSVDDPQPRADEALIRVSAISLNRGEVRGAQAAKPGARPGWDIAGVVEKEAADGSGPKAGQRVVGMLRTGAWAELIDIPTPNLAVLPDNVSFQQALDAARRRPDRPLRPRPRRRTHGTQRADHRRLGRRRQHRHPDRRTGRRPRHRAGAPGAPRRSLPATPAPTTSSRTRPARRRASSAPTTTSSKSVGGAGAGQRAEHGRARRPRRDLRRLRRRPDHRRLHAVPALAHGRQRPGGVHGAAEGERRRRPQPARGHGRRRHAEAAHRHRGAVDGDRQRRAAAARPLLPGQGGR